MSKKTKVTILFSKIRVIIKNYPRSGKQERIKSLCLYMYEDLPSELQSFIDKFICLNPSSKARVAYKNTKEFHAAARKWLYALGSRDCKTCGKHIPAQHPFRLGYREYCNKTCRFNNRELNDQKTKARKASYEKKYGPGITSWLATAEGKASLVAASYAKYGTASPLQNPQVKAKIKNTNLEKTGYPSPFHNPEIQAKITNTWNKRGYENTMQCPETKKSFVDSNMKKYGVANAMQNYKVFQKCMRSNYKIKKLTVGKYVFTGLQGYEPQAIKYLILEDKVDPARILTGKNNINPINYRFKGKNHIYFPDIFIQGKVGTFIEVKSTYTVTVDFKRNLAKLRAVKDAGYNAALMVVDSKGNLLRLIKPL